LKNFVFSKNHKENPDAAVKNEENGFSYIEMNYKRYMIKTSLIQ